MMPRPLFSAAFLLAAAASAAGQSYDRLQVSVEAQRAEYFVGEPVLLKFGVENISDAPVTIGAGGDYRGGTRPHRFGVTGVDERGMPLIDPDPNQMLMGGLGGDREIKPGETVWASVMPLRYCLLDRPGTITFTISHDLLSSKVRHDPLATTRPAPPQAKITLRFLMPDAAQAERLVDGLVAMKDDGYLMGFSEKPAGDVRREFGTLRLPIYLPALAKHARAGKPEVVAGIGSIETPEATRELIALLHSETPAVVQQVIWPLRQRLPEPASALNTINYFRQTDTTGRYAALQKATWRPEFAADLLRFSLDELKRDEPRSITVNWDTLADAAYLLEVTGTKEDAPVVYDALERAVQKNERHPSVTASFAPARNTGPLLRTAAALVARGAAPPDAGRLAAQALELYRLQADDRYRPHSWQKTLTSALDSPHPSLREQALAVLIAIPEPPPESVKQRLAGFLAGSDPLTRKAALGLAGKAGDRSLAQPILQILRTSNDRDELSMGGASAEKLGARYEWLTICAGRLAANWDLFASPLFATLDYPGGGTTGKPSVADAAAAQKAWIDFLAAHKEALSAGQRIPVEAASPALLPPPNQLRLSNGKTWPPRP